MLGLLILIILNSCKTYLDNTNKTLRYGDVTLTSLSNHNKLIYDSDSFGRAENEIFVEPKYTFNIPKRLKSISTSGSNMFLELFNDQYISIRIKCREDCLNEILREINLNYEDVEDLFENENFAYDNQILQFEHRLSHKMENQFVAISLLNIKPNLLNEYIEYTKAFNFIEPGNVKRVNLNISRYKLYKDTILIKEWNSGAARIPVIELRKEEFFDELRLEIKNENLDSQEAQVFEAHFYCNIENPKDQWNNRLEDLVFSREDIIKAFSKCELNDGVIMVLSNVDSVIGAVFQIKILD